MTEERNKAEEPLETTIVEEAAETTDKPENEEQAAETINTEEDIFAAMQNEMSRLQDEVSLAKDQVLRAAAEVQNIKRRAQLDVEKAHKFALDKFVESLLPVVDSLELGLKNAADADDANTGMREGMELTLKLMIDTLAKNGVEQLNPIGEPLDPNYHQAITMLPNPEMEPNTVMDVVQKGYTLNGRCVRPAMVVVVAG